MEHGKWTVWLPDVILIFALLAPAHAATIDISSVLAGVENRYNQIKTLEVGFTETLTARGRKRTEKGDLYLRKPGRMRWQYSSPAGKLFISDGKYIYSYTPAEHRAEKMPFKETEDMRAPLAFLLGRLHFQDDFRQESAQMETNSNNIIITAIPKSDKLPYSQVKFLVSPDSVIHWLSIQEQDGSTLEFVFENEKKNPPIPDSMFHFVPPPGVEYVDSGK